MTMIKISGHRLLIAALGIGLSLAASGAAAQSQGSDSDAILEAIEEQDNGKLIDLVTRRGRGIVNSRGYSGETPLTLAMRRRSGLYVNYLLQHGAEPNLANRNGDTGLTIAARLGYAEGINSMLAAAAPVDTANRQGETALIVAVQARHAGIVKRLLEAGANPARTDTASGLSARDYAVRDRRSTEILKLIDSTKKKPVFVAGPIIQ